MTTSFRIIWNNWSCHCVDELSTEKTTVYRHRRTICLRQYNGRGEEIEAFNAHLNLKIIDTLFNTLENIITEAEGINYEVEVCDGSHWILIIRHSDRSIKKIAGTIKAPSAAMQLESMIKSMLVLSGCKIEPILFGC